MELIKNISKILNKKIKFYLLFIFLTIFLAMILEAISLASFYPLLEILNSNSDQAQESKIKDLFFNTLNYLNISEKDFFVTLLIMVASLFILKILILLFCYWHGSNFAFVIRFYLTKILYKTYLKKNYQSLIKYNSADIIKNIDYEIHMFGSGITSIMTFLTEGLIFLSILIFLFFFNLKVTLSIVLICCVIFLILQFSYNRLLLKWSNAAQMYHKNRTKNFIETFNAIKEIKIFSKENLFYNLMENFNKKFFNANRNQRFLTNIPKAVLETSLIIIVSIYLINLNSQDQNFTYYFSDIGIYLIAAYRVFPSVNRMIVSLQTIKFSSTFIKNISNQILSENINFEENLNDFIDKPGLNFKNNLELKNCNFSFNNGKNIINNLSLKFEKGKIYGIKGVSGSGKTTLLNLISGLISPDSGQILLDGKEINNTSSAKLLNVGYVPQSVFLFDMSIAKNIHLNIKDNSENDFKKISSLIENLDLGEKIASLSKGLHTDVGERGVNLSGGQIQRIGIARALYHDPKLLILDEATNAIEKELEMKVLKYLNNLKKDKIIIIVAHRESVFESCDKVYKLS